MNAGWVVQTDEGRVVHVREAIVPDPLGEEVAIQLQEEEKEGLVLEERETPWRIVGKQPERTPRKIPLPKPGAYGSLEEMDEPTPSTPPKSPRSDPDEKRVASSSGGG